MLKKAEGLRHANIGTEELANDLTAKVVDMPNITSLATVEDLIQEVLVISPTEALIDTAATQQTWEQRISELTSLDQQPTIAAIRWRKAKGGGTRARPRGL